MKKIIGIFLLLLTTAAAATAYTAKTVNLSGIQVTLDKDKNLKAESIETGSIADKAGLKENDRIMAIDNTPVYNDPAYAMTSMDGVLSSGRSVLLLVIREGEKKTLWLKQARSGIHQKEAFAVYNDVQTEWKKIKQEWQDFSGHLNQVSLHKMTSEEFQKLSLKNAERLQVLRSRLIDHDRKILQSQPAFEKEITRAKDLACYTVFTMDQIIQKAVHYSGNSQINIYFDRLKRKEDEISKYLSKVELHLFKAKQTADII